MKFNRSIIDQYIDHKFMNYYTSKEPTYNHYINYIYIQNTYLIPYRAGKVAYCNVDAFMWCLENNLVEQKVIDDIQEFMIGSL
jgi:hypothetical protein